MKKQMELEKRFVEQELSQILERTLNWENELSSIMSYTPKYK